MNITYYGHSCFGIELGGKHLLFDPFISPNEKAKHIDVDTIPADYIFISHGHEDHIADVVNIASRTGAKVIASWEIYAWLQKQGVVNGHPMNTGGQWNFGDFSVKCVVAQHSSSLPDGTYGGNPMGFVFSTKEGNFYYSGDTALTYEMKLIAEMTELKFAFLCLGDNFTMGVKDAIKAADFIGCENIVGMHYDTFGFIVISHEKAIADFAESGKQLRLLAIGETLEM